MKHPYKENTDTPLQKVKSNFKGESKHSIIRLSLPVSCYSPSSPSSSAPRGSVDHKVWGANYGSVGEKGKSAKNTTLFCQWKCHSARISTIVLAEQEVWIHFIIFHKEKKDENHTSYSALSLSICNSIRVSLVLTNNACYREKCTSNNITKILNPINTIFIFTLVKYSTLK